MRLQFWHRRNRTFPDAFYVQITATLFLLGLSALIVACGSPSTNASMGQPQVTVTIDLDHSGGSPTPPLPAYSCSAWITNTTPNINGTTTIDVYAKFVHNINGNPVGVSPAQGTASVLWPEGTINVSATTSSDGLAVFPVSIANHRADLDQVVQVTVAFSGPQGVPPCVVSADRAAFFQPVIGSPVASPTSGTGATPAATGTSNPLPSPCPTPKRPPRPCR